MKNPVSLNQPSWLWVAAAAVVGLLVGWLLLGWWLFPIEWKDADSWDLNAAAKQDYVAMVADSFNLNQDVNLARERLRGFPTIEIEQFLRQLIVERNTKGDATGAARLDTFARTYGINVRGTAAATPGAPSGATTPGQAQGSLLESLGPLLLLLAGLVILAAAVLFILMRVRQPAAPRPARRPAPQAERYQEVPPTRAPAPVENPQPAVATAPIAAPVQAAPKQAAPAARPPAQAAAKSLGTFAATYKFGDDNYDTSFTLETARGEFLGECGMGISETLGEGKPDKVTAFDLWLFDKTDVRTVTQILMTEHAFNDQMLRQRLATKGELTLAEKGKHIKLETATLVVDAEIVDLVYASTPGLPTNSHFQKLIVEMVPSQK